MFARAHSPALQVCPRAPARADIDGGMLGTACPHARARGRGLVRVFCQAPRWRPGETAGAGLCAGRAPMQPLSSPPLASVPDAQVRASYPHSATKVRARAGRRAPCTAAAVASAAGGGAPHGAAHRVRESLGAALRRGANTRVRALLECCCRYPSASCSSYHPLWPSLASHPTFFFFYAGGALAAKCRARAWP